MPFSRLLIWREQTDHLCDFFFYCTPTLVFSNKNKKKITYSGVCSATYSAPPVEALLALRPTGLLSKEYAIVDEEKKKFSSLSTNDDKHLLSLEDGPHLVNQSELNGLIQHLNLSKTQQNTRI